MGAQVVDYRVSTLVVLCKDCGQDVGLYPSRHKCQTSISRPPVPALPTRFAESNESLQVPRKPVHSPDASTTSGLSSRPTSSASSSSFSSMPSPNFSDTTASSSPSSGKWARFGQRSKQQDDQQQQQDGDDSIYFNKFAEHLPDQEPQGKKLWGKVRQNEKWKQMTEKNDTQKQSGKLWGKLLSATQNMADKLPSRDDRGPDSDESDWEGETHVSRVLREYYEKKRRPLPNWLRDERTPTSSANYKQSPSSHQQHINDTRIRPQSPRDDMTKPSSSRRRLWDHSQELSSRERERQELRQQQPPPTEVNDHQHRPLSPPHSGRQYRGNGDHYDDEYSAYTASKQHGYRRGYDDHERGYRNNDHPSYRDHYQQHEQQPTSFRSNARISQDESRMGQQQRQYMRSATPDHRGGYENDLDDYYHSGRQHPPSSSSDRLRGPRNPSSRPNRYLDANSDYY